MGTTTSKQQDTGDFKVAGSFRKSWRRKSSTSDDITKNHLIINNLKAEIDIFEGNRKSARYKEFHEILTTISKKLQLIKSKNSKQATCELCDAVLGEIQNCFQRLETRINFVEQNENSLDLAAVESHSFINHSFGQNHAFQNQAQDYQSQSPKSLDLIQNIGQPETSPISSQSSNQKPPPPALLNHNWAKELPMPSNSRQPKFDPIKNIERLEQETQNLEREIRRCIDLEDHKQFKILEKKIEILYVDLEMILADDNTPLSERKSAIGKRLIKYNNHVKKAKKALEAKASDYSSKQDGPAFSKPTKNDAENNRERTDLYVDFDKVESKLEELEIQALTFEGIKSDRKYKELEQVLENYWTRVHSADAFGTKEKNRKGTIIDRIKIILQELRNRAEENEKQAVALGKLKNIAQEVQVLNKKSGEFQGTTQDASYLQIDQNLRSLWANITSIEEPNEHIRRSKTKVVNEIQGALKRLSQDTTNRESLKQVSDDKPPTKRTSPDSAVVTDEEIHQIQLLNQVKEFQNHWNQLNYNLDVKNITKSEISKEIVEHFEKIMDGINRKRNALEIVEKRKSTGSLVVARVIENTDLIKTITSHSSSVQNLTAIDKHERDLNAAKAPQAYSSERIYENHQPRISVSTVSYYNHSRNATPDFLQKPYASASVLKPMETEIKVQPTVKTIGEMQRVGAEAKALLQQIRQSNCIKNDNEYKSLYAKLEQCKATLESIEYNKRSDTIESNRRRAFKTINEAFRALDEKDATPAKSEQDSTAAIRSSKAQEVMDIDAEIQYFRQQIKNFTGVTKDAQYEKVKHGLADCLTKLQIMDAMHMSKQDSIRHIQQYHQELETKLAENQAKVRVMEQNVKAKRQTSQDIRIVIEQVQKLKGQVERFSGVYQGLLYKQIEENLNSSAQKLDAIDAKGDEKLESAKLQTKDKIRKYLTVLEDKSTKTSTIDRSSPNGAMVDQQGVQVSAIVENVAITVAKKEELIQTQAENQQVPPQNQRNSVLLDSTSPHYKINALRDKLVEIKDKTETFSGRFKDEQYRDIETDILTCLNELKLIDDRGHNSVIISKEQYEEYIAKLMKYFEDKSKIQAEEPDQFQQTNTQIEAVKDAVNYSYPIQTKQTLQTFKIVDPMEELTTTTRKIEDVKGRINGFNGLPDDDEYKDLHELLTNEIVKLEKLQASNVAHVRELKSKLAKELFDYKRILEYKGSNCLEITVREQQINRIRTILQEVSKISKEVYAFQGVKNDKDFCYLDEVLIRLMIELDNIETYNDNSIKEERKKAIQIIQKNIKTLNDRAKSKQEVNMELTTTTV